MGMYRGRGAHLARFEQAQQQACRSRFARFSRPSSSTTVGKSRRKQLRCRLQTTLLQRSPASCSRDSWPPVGTGELGGLGGLGGLAASRQLQRRASRISTVAVDRFSV